MPLDLSDQESTNQELNEFKSKVKTVAKAYTERHGWCDVVNQALAEIGVEPTGIRAEVEVQFTLKVPVAITDTAPLLGKTPEEQNALIAESIAKDRPILIPNREDNGLRYLSSNDVISGDSIKVLDINKVEGVVGAAGVPEGYQALFTSAEGRVRHYVTEYNAGRHYGTALCGAASSYRWTNVSSRDEGRTCQSCEDRATRNNLPRQTPPRRRRR